MVATLKQLVSEPSGVLLARNASVSTQLKHLAMTERDAVKTQS